MAVARVGPLAVFSTAVLTAARRAIGTAPWRVASAGLALAGAMLASSPGVAVAAGGGGGVGGRVAAPATFANGLPTRSDFFPIAVWLQSPHTEGHSGPNRNQALAMKAQGINIAIGLHNWPTAFGRDRGEVDALKEAGIYLIGSIDPADNTSIRSVASVQALVTARGYTGLVGYHVKDEPLCGVGPGEAGHAAAEIAAVRSYDPTRPTFMNSLPFVPWIKSLPNFGFCNGSLQQQISAFIAPDVSSFDNYPVTMPYFYNAWWACGGGAYVAPGDFTTRAQDCLWTQGLGTQAARSMLGPTDPLWQFVETGTDNLGQSGQANTFLGAVTRGSSVLTNQSGISRFTSSWLGLAVTGDGIPAGTRITGVIDPLHATLSAPANGDFNRSTITVVNACVKSVNLCVVNGNQYRATPAQVNSQAWMSIINGAVGIEWFCHDTLATAFCLGDTTNSDARSATAIAENLTYINNSIHRFATVLNAPTVGGCSMQKLDLSTTIQCAGGILTLKTSTAPVPGMALVKRLGGVTYLLAQSGRNSANGATFTYGLNGLAGTTATIVYDSNSRYDPSNSMVGRTSQLDNLGRFSDILGANGNNYQVKIYTIQ